MKVQYFHLVPCVFLNTKQCIKLFEEQTDDKSQRVVMLQNVDKFFGKL